jgi:hypothetical protein
MIAQKILHHALANILRHAFYVQDLRHCQIFYTLQPYTTRLSLVYPCSVRVEHVHLKNRTPVGSSSRRTAPREQHLQRIFALNPPSTAQGVPHEPR